MPTFLNPFSSAMSAAHYGIAIFILIALVVAYRGLCRNSAIRQLNVTVKQGNMTQLKLPPYGRYELDWQKIYGPVHRFKGCFGQDRLMISDPVALQYILNSPQFKLGPGLENLVHLLYPKGSIMSLTTETTSTTLPFGLIELEKAPYLQEKLRAEIHATVGSTRASSVAYNSMLLLNAFITSICYRDYLTTHVLPENSPQTRAFNSATPHYKVFDDDGSQKVPSVKL
ncbi:hypothetical protein B0H14DRAFT_2625759 [Mycena olivaceomarginata]|nr:hypothetical protein B0H14DRAFT_2625759 [Mycena olivaceomarginata]